MLELIKSRIPAHEPISRWQYAVPAKSKNHNLQNQKSPEPSEKTSYRGRAKQLLTTYWSGEICPPNKLRERATFLIRLAKRSGWSQDKILNLLIDWTRDLPAEASSKIAKAQWTKLDKDLARMTEDIYERGYQPQQELSDQKLDRVLEVWSKQGFRWWDKETWDATETKRER